MGRAAPDPRKPWRLTGPCNTTARFRRPSTPILDRFRNDSDCRGAADELRHRQRRAQPAVRELCLPVRPLVEPAVEDQAINAHRIGQKHAVTVTQPDRGHDRAADRRDPGTETATLQRPALERRQAGEPGTHRRRDLRPLRPRAKRAAGARFNGELAEDHKSCRCGRSRSSV